MLVTGLLKKSEYCNKSNKMLEDEATYTEANYNPAKYVNSQFTNH